MDTQQSLEQQVVKVVTKFTDEYLKMTPESVLVDVHPHCVLVTLQGIVPPVERDYAKGEQACELLEKCYSSAFSIIRRPLEKALGRILGQLIESSMLRVALDSGNCVIIFNLRS